LEGQLGRDYDKPYDSEPKPVPNIRASSQVKQVVCGWGHTLLLMSDGRLLGWGANLHGQLGVGVKEKMSKVVEITSIQEFGGRKVSQIACGGVHSIALSEGNDIFVWGSAADGKLGLGTPTEDRLIPTLLSFDHLFKSQNLEMAPKQIVCGPDHSAVLFEDVQSKSTRVCVW